jgi:hypothetical protein
MCHPSIFFQLHCGTSGNSQDALEKFSPVVDPSCQGYKVLPF